jgi:hypothetical protein
MKPTLRRPRIIVSILTASLNRFYTRRLDSSVLRSRTVTVAAVACVYTQIGAQTFSIFSCGLSYFTRLLKNCWSSRNSEDKWLLCKNWKYAQNNDRRLDFAPRIYVVCNFRVTF